MTEFGFLQELLTEDWQMDRQNKISKDSGGQRNKFILVQNGKYWTGKTWSDKEQEATQFPNEQHANEAKQFLEKYKKQTNISVIKLK